MTAPTYPDTSEWICRHCGIRGQVEIEHRPKLTPAPVGSFSLAGVGVKFSATTTRWPWAVCRACGHESEGKADA